MTLTPPTSTRSTCHLPLHVPLHFMVQAVSPEKILPLMGPYCAFVAFATALTYNIHRNNHQVG